METGLNNALNLPISQLLGEVVKNLDNMGLEPGLKDRAVKVLSYLQDMPESEWSEKVRESLESLLSIPKSDTEGDLVEKVRNLVNLVEGNRNLSLKEEVSERGEELSENFFNENLPSQPHEDEVVG